MGASRRRFVQFWYGRLNAAQRRGVLRSSIGFSLAWLAGSALQLATTQAEVGAFGGTFWVNGVLGLGLFAAGVWLYATGVAGILDAARLDGPPGPSSEAP